MTEDGQTPLWRRMVADGLAIEYLGRRPWRPRARTVLRRADGKRFTLQRYRGRPIRDTTPGVFGVHIGRCRDVEDAHGEYMMWADRQGAQQEDWPPRTAYYAECLWRDELRIFLGGDVYLRYLHDTDLRY